jgi:DNA-binding NtrC family response regulator
LYIFIFLPRDDLSLFRDVCNISLKETNVSGQWTSFLTPPESHAMSVSSYQILVIDDSKRDILLLERTLQQAEDATPVMMLTAFGQDRLPVAAVQAVALDYFAKDQVSSSLLSQAIIQAIETARLQVRAAAEDARLRELEAMVAQLQQPLNKQGGS